jgi:hypothetical protein
MLNRRGQSISGEYLLTLFIVVAMMTAMVVYFRRAIQARVHDAQGYMFEEIAERAKDHYNELLYGEYEPYYTETVSEIIRQSEIKQSLRPGGTSGRYRRDIDEETRVDTQSITAPPKEGD